MTLSKPEFFYAAVGTTIILVATVLSHFMQPWLAWFVGGICGAIPMWYSLPPERRVLWKTVVNAVCAGLAAATIVYFLN
jgi:hypothetical protein